MDVVVDTVAPQVVDGPAQGRARSSLQDILGGGGVFAEGLKTQTFVAKVHLTSVTGTGH